MLTADNGIICGSALYRSGCGEASSPTCLVRFVIWCASSLYRNILVQIFHIVSSKLVALLSNLTESWNIKKWRKKRLVKLQRNWHSLCLNVRGRHKFPVPCAVPYLVFGSVPLHSFLQLFRQPEPEDAGSCWMKKALISLTGPLVLLTRYAGCYSHKESHYVIILT